MSNEPMWPQVQFAFPFDVTVDRERHISPGMTLRDYFAAKFMAARLANHTADPHITDADMARIAYERADAMLRAREAKP